MSAVSVSAEVGWPVLCIGRLGRFLKGNGLSKKELVPVGVPCIRYGELYTKHRFVVRQFHSYIPEDLAARSVPLARGDVLFAASGETLDEIGKSAAYLLDERACVGGDIIVFRPGRKVDSHFLGYALESTPAVAQKSQMGHGITVMHIYASELKYLRLHVPPLPTQKAIAAFLDRKTAAIDALIEKKQKLLDLLAEKRAALINQAVTKGLDPNVPMKDSGIPWIGEIPAHWEVVQVRRLLDRLDQGWSPVAHDRAAEDGEWAVLKLSAVSKGVFRPDQHKVLLDGDDPRPELTVHPDDVLVTRANTPHLVGDACIVGTHHPRLMLSDLIYRLRLNHRALPNYLCLFLTSTPGRAPITADARGSSQSMVKISQGHIKAWPVPVPPPEEQSEVATVTNRRLGRLHAMEDVIRVQIDRLNEYRQALITAAVTGQLDITEDPPT